MGVPLLATVGAVALFAAHYAPADFPLTADPGAPQWRVVTGVVAANDTAGRPVAGHRTEIRARWTRGYLYLLYICPYEKLHLHPSPSTRIETNQLWDWDVAEAFIGSDFEHIRRYKEFEVSPQGEWVDLDINLDTPHPADGWRWNSGFETKARIDEAHHTWYAEMKIPFSSIDPRPPEKGAELRINLYRCQGPPDGRKFIAWQPTGRASFHVPESFGRLVLE